MERLKQGVGKVLYGFLFVVLLPSLLFIWAVGTSKVVTLPSVHSMIWGLMSVAGGILIMALGMTWLMSIGGGLPMNAFPPPRYVSSGIYGIFSHPIYVGFAFLCVGVAIAAGSASGLWLIVPTVILASTALVLGYELPDMQSRFGEAFPRDRLFPADEATVPTGMERVRCYLTVLVPWLLLYEGIVALGVPADARVAYLPFESRWPVWQWTEIFYATVYAVVILVPLLVRTRHDLRLFSRGAWISMLIVFPIFIAIPLIAPPRPFAVDSIWGQLLKWDRAHDSAAAAFPSYHVIWAFLAARAIGTKSWQRWIAFAWALLASISCLTTGMHALVDVFAAGVILFAVFQIDAVWAFLRGLSERIANSWQEWRIGPVRIINHGAYAALGVFVGVLIIDTLLGPGKATIPVSISLGGLIGAALWAQWIEGSPRLLRPLGFYGGMLGTVVGGGLAARWSDTNLWLVLAALVVAAPWIQGIGRLRCLVQGCCHGRRADEDIGIRYVHPQSRVLRVEGLRGIPIHPTPLYSLLWNVVVAVIVTRIYSLHTPATIVGGAYLILSGIGRFVEEAYRGEPQTPIVGGLRIYQWIAIATVVVGAGITTVPGPLTLRPIWHWSSIVPALACGALAWFVTGVDFPASNRRFARLT